MKGTTELESAVLEKLLAGRHPSLVAMRAQLAAGHVIRREMTGHGFCTYFDVGDAPVLSNLKLRFGDVVGNIEGVNDGVGFELFIQAGRLSMLEGYAYEEPWPSRITKFTLNYTTGEARDWNELNKVLE